MTLDDLIDVLQRLKEQYPAAGVAPVFCPLDLSEPYYDKGFVSLGVRLVSAMDEIEPAKETKH